LCLAANAALGALVTGSTVDAGEKKARGPEAGDDVASKLLEVALSHITDEAAAPDDASASKAPLSPKPKLPRTTAEQQDTARLAALRWVLVLHAHRPAVVEQHIADKIVPSLLKLLSARPVATTASAKAEDSSASPVAEPTVRLALDVLASVSGHHEKHFDALMVALVRVFRRNRGLLERRGIVIITHLCVLLTPQRIFVSLARILSDMIPLSGDSSDADESSGMRADSHTLEFVTTMVRTLNLILLTAPEVYDLRVALKSITSFEANAFAKEDEAEKLNQSTVDALELFTTLYRAWCHSAASAFSLCLLSRLFQHRAAADLVSLFGELEVTVPFLLECDKIVSLIESPVFVDLRLQLVDPSSHPYLFKALFGLLALLPQSAAFHTLQTRLQASAVAAPTLLTLPGQLSKAEGKSDKKTAQKRAGAGAARDAETLQSLLDHFRIVQTMQNRVRQNQRLDGRQPNVAQETG
jgi:vacuole morphology and inheritance protein 14